MEGASPGAELRSADAQSVAQSMRGTCAKLALGVAYGEKTVSPFCSAEIISAATRHQLSAMPSQITQLARRRTI
jgi:predicted thioredoxin/glutaredoxin